MISDDYPRVCGHRQCKGHAVPATWMYISRTYGTTYYCTRHAHRRSKNLYNESGMWVSLTPNQRPVSVKE